MPVHIDEIVVDVEPEPGEGTRGGGGGGGAAPDEPRWFCAELQKERAALERRERLRVD